MLYTYGFRTASSRSHAARPAHPRGPSATPETEATIKDNHTHNNCT